MTFSKTWHSGSTSLFLMEKQPKWLSCTAVSALKWNSSLSEVCPYCGSPSRGKCTNCGGVGSERVYQSQGAEVILVGRLPMAAQLFFLEDECDFEIHFIECGPIDCYWPGNTIFRLRECKIVKRWMESNVVSLTPDDAEDLRIAVKLECLAELLLRGEEWSH